MRNEFGRLNTTFLNSANLVKSLKEQYAYEDRPWHECNGGKPITTTKIAAMLKPFGIKSYRNAKTRLTGTGWRIAKKPS